MTEFDFATLEHRLRELAFLNSGVHIVLTDARHAEIKTEDCIMKAASRPSSAISTAPKRRCMRPPMQVRGERDGITVEVAMEWTDSYHENVLCFTNNIPQRDGGTHLAGFRAALTRTINNYAESRHRQEGKGRPDRRRMREGLTCVLSVKVPDPKFSSPDQGQAGVVGGAPGGRERGRRDARPMVRGASRRGQESSARWSRRPPPARRRARRAN